MHIINDSDWAMLQAYKSLGSPEDIRQQISSPYPTNDDYAPLPFGEMQHDGAGVCQACFDVDPHCAYCSPDDEKEFSGLLDEE